MSSRGMLALAAGLTLHVGCGTGELGEVDVPGASAAPSGGDGPGGATTGAGGATGGGGAPSAHSSTAATTGAGGGGGSGGAEPLVCPDASAPPPSTIETGLVPEAWDLAPVTGTDHRVGSLEELMTALDGAQPGDAVTIEGAGHVWGEVVIEASGTAESPLVIRSGEAGPTFTGATRVVVTGSHVHLQGLSFHDVTTGALKVEGTSAAPATGNRLSMIHCRQVTGYCLLIGNAEGTRFDHSLIERSGTKGIHVGNSTRHTRIDHNLFRDKTQPLQPNGFEQIQLGHATFTATDEGADSWKTVRTDALIDHNVFQKCEGEGEMIGIKSAGNKIVFNVIVDAHEVGRVSFRGGPNNLAFGNVMRDTQGGMRLMGKSNRVVHNLIVDPAVYPGVDLVWGSDTAYRRNPDDAFYTVEYVAVREGMVRNNGLIVTSHATSAVRAMAEDRQSPGECQAGDGGLDCTVSPFDNTIVRNVLVNDWGGATVKLSPELVSLNTFSTNFAALSEGATLGTTEEMTAELERSFPPPAAEVATRHRALGEHVWNPEPDVCLRLPADAQLDDTEGVAFEPGACEQRCEDEGAAWMAVDLFATEGVEQFVDDQTLMERLEAMPTMVVPAIPPRPPT